MAPLSTNLGGMRSMRKSSIIDNRTWCWGKIPTSCRPLACRPATTSQQQTSHYSRSLIPSEHCDTVTATRHRAAPSTADIAATYKDDLSTTCLLAEEMHRWQHRYQGKKPQQCPDACAKAIKVCEKDTFPNLHVLLQLACTISVTSCECERSASALRRLHTYMWASMGQSRLSSLALIHIHYDIAVDLDKTVDLFPQMYPRKLELKNLLDN